MKKKILALIAAIMVVVCAGCSQAHDHNHEEITTTTQPIKTYSVAGKINGNTYSNDFADLTFLKPAKWTFLEGDVLQSLGGDSTVAIPDMAAVDGTTNTSVKLVFLNSITISGKSLTAKEYCDQTIKNAADEGDMSTVTAESEVTLGGNNYLKIVLETSDINNPMSITHYVRAIDYYIVDITASTPCANAAQTDFESMFS